MTRESLKRLILWFIHQMPTPQAPGGSYHTPDIVSVRRMLFMGISQSQWPFHVARLFSYVGT